MFGTLIFIRILGFLAIAPVWKHVAVISQVKWFFAAILAVMMTSAFWTEQITLDFHAWNIVLLVFKEFVCGLMIGFSANMCFYAARFAGGLIDVDMGYQPAAMFDVSETPAMIGELKELIMLMLFLYIGGPGQLIEALYASVKAVPISTFAISGATVKLMTQFATSVLIVGVKIAAPMIVAIFITNLSMALLARVAPQTNIFVLSFQLRMVVGLIVLFFSVPLFVFVSKLALDGFQEETMRIIMSLYPPRTV
jgi:flagellar biosynthetic protein FliR